jgi:glycosyltransferase involved in cell wall biosynthesis
MKVDPLVSIITPTYNHGKFISDCIQSAQNQTFDDWEMLIMNDGSTDNTAEIAADFAKNDQRIFLTNQSNVGIFKLSETYNLALAKARGKYIAILEGDDLWEPDKLERQVKSLDQNTDVVLAWSPAYQVNVDQTQKFIVSPNLKTSENQLFSNNPRGCLLNVLFFRNCIPALTVLIRKDALIRIGGFHQGYDLPLVDVPTWQLLCASGEFHYDPKPSGSWRVYPEQTTKMHLVQIFSGFYKLSLNNYAIFSENKSLSFSVTIKMINDHFRKMMIMSYSREGRYMLIRKQFREARIMYIKAITSRGGEYMWKIRAIIGIAISFFHLDVEWLARILKRPTYKS